MKTNRVTPFAALLAFCVAAPTFAQPQPQPQTQTQTQTQTPAQSQTPAQPQPPAQAQPATTAQPTPPAQPQPATTAQPMTPAQPTPQGSTPPTPGSTPTPVGTTGTSSVADTAHGTEILLLDRVQKVLDKAIEDAKGGQITIDRGLLDEMRAEVTQVRTALQGPKP
jgi:outer membrane biosynthesis protein TonB